MRVSCNGCRVLRKGCSDDCTIRACLHWIKSPEAQANATLFLAKFYGRAGLLNLIATGPDHLRPSIFKSLLYEACGRVVNPVDGSVGLLWSGKWEQCQAAVDAVLGGSPITGESNFSHAPDSLMKACDIRHVAKPVGSADVPTVKTRNRSKRATVNRAASHDSGNLSAETVEASLVYHGAKRGRVDEEDGLNLSLGLPQVSRNGNQGV